MSLEHRMIRQGFITAIFEIISRWAKFVWQSLITLFILPIPIGGLQSESHCPKRLVIAQNGCRKLSWNITSFTQQ